jgi:general secretion pathway protein I
LFRATQPSIDRSEAGFTIIEVLIALAVVAVSILAIGSVMSTNVRGVRSLEQHVTLMQTVRAVMTAEMPPAGELAFGAITDQVNDYRWRIDVGPFGDDWAVAGANIAWRPALVTLQVRSPSGAVSEVKTVRLIHGPPK